MYAFLVRSSLNDWARLFKARFIAVLHVGLGALALLVPGMVLAVRYAFVEVVAIHENANGTEARRRSAELASGRSTTILRLFLSVFAAVLVASILMGFPLVVWPQLDNFVTAAIGDTLIDVALTTVYGGAWFIYDTAKANRLPDRPTPIA